MNTQLMEGYRIGLAEMREKCAKVVESGVLGHGECAAAIRAINFEGDTGFRPVSEMIAEHKQDPKKAAAIEKAKMRKAEQEPVAIGWQRRNKYLPAAAGKTAEWEQCFSEEATDMFSRNPRYEYRKIYAAPVRTKDLTDDEIEDLYFERFSMCTLREFARAIIAADREKNK